MGLFKKIQQKIQNPENGVTIFKKENFTSENKRNERNIQEKKRQLKFEQAALDNEKYFIEHDTRIDTLKEELEQIQQKQQLVRGKNKKRRRKLIVLWLVIFVIAFSFYEGIRKKKLEEYQQQLETELENYSSEIGEQNKNYNCK